VSAGNPWQVSFPKKPVTMTMHESMVSSCGIWSVLRVYNGWIYTMWTFRDGHNDWEVVTSSFVPMNKKEK
jgi:hypothetical protein